MTNLVSGISIEGNGTESEIPLRVNESGALLSTSVANKVRDAFEVYVPNGEAWAETKASGDIITVDGNALAASYLVISKDPLAADTASLIEGKDYFTMPYEAVAGLHMSQRTLGQEFSFEIVDVDDVTPALPDLAISTMSQSGTTLTVTTATPHGLVVGKRIGIYGCADSRFNYPALVVATTPNATQFTVTAGPGGTIQSLTAGPVTSGFVFFRSALGFAANGSSMIFENNSTTSGSFYLRSEAGDALPSGTVNGSHAITVASTASVQAVNAALNYAFQPTSEYSLIAAIDGVQWRDVAVDSLSSPTSRVKRTQVVPDPAARYKVRIRATNNKSLPVPVAQIVSAAKSGSTTATVVTDVPHGLTTGDYVTLHSNRDTVNFANVTTGTVVASVVNATTFTIIWGSAVTATGYGGFVARAQGGQTIQGVSSQVIQSVTITGGIVQAVGSASWTGANIGDYVNLVGVRNAVNGGSLGIDGAYRVRDIQTTTIFLEAIGSTATPANIGSTNCGGAIIRRTDIRISFLRVLDFERMRIETAARPNNDISASIPVQITGNNGTNIVQGSQANNASTVPNPVLVSSVGLSANPTAGTSGRQQQSIGTLIGVPIVRPFSIPEADWQNTITLTTTTSTALKAVAGAGIKNYMTGMTYQNTSATATTLNILRGTTVVASFNAPASMALPAVITFPTPLQTVANEALNAQCGTAGANVLVNGQGYAAP